MVAFNWLIIPFCDEVLGHYLLRVEVHLRRFLTIVRLMASSPSCFPSLQPACRLPCLNMYSRIHMQIGWQWRPRVREFCEQIAICPITFEELLCFMIKYVSIWWYQPMILPLPAQCCLPIANIDIIVNSITRFLVITIYSCMSPRSNSPAQTGWMKKEITNITSNS